jgi:hypothetical protein
MYRIFSPSYVLSTGGQRLLSSPTPLQVAHIEVLETVPHGHFAGVIFSAEKRVPIGQRDCQRVFSENFDESSRDLVRSL